MDPGLIELFVDGTENALPDSGRLDGLGLGSGSVVFMLIRLGWRWEACGSSITLSGEGLVATRDETCSTQLLTGGSPMTEGRHYWEVELTCADEDCCISVGAARPGLDHGKNEADGQGEFAKGDRIGVLLDLDAGWMRLYRNDKRCGPGFAEGVTGPLVHAAQLVNKGDKVTVLPGAAAPTEGAGASDEQ